MELLQTVTPEGWLFNRTGFSTVSRAALELIPVDEQVLLTMALYKLPFIVVVILVRFKEVFVSPLMLVKVVPPSVLTCH